MPRRTKGPRYSWAKESHGRAWPFVVVDHSRNLVILRAREQDEAERVVEALEGADR